LWNAQGRADRAVLGGGAEPGAPADSLCVGGTARCAEVAFDRGLFPYARSGSDDGSWQGTLLVDKPNATGTYYRRNRNYDPNTARFTQEDPTGLAGGINRYGFASGDPVTYSDPLGLCKEGVQATGAHEEANRTTVITCADSTEEVRHGGTPAWRNNNPGNLNASKLAVGTSRGFAVFNTVAEGNEAMWEQLGRDAARGLTLGEWISKYAPPSENDTQRYLDVVARGSGIGANTSLAALTETSIQDVILAMQRHEGWSPGTVIYRPIQP